MNQTLLEADTPAVVKQSPQATVRGIRFTLLASFLASLLWALLCNFVLELTWAQAVGHPEQLVVWVLDDRLTTFLIGSLAVWVTTVFFVSLTGRLWLSFGIMLAVSMAFGYANALKFSQRSEPIYPSDLHFLRETRFLVDMVGTVPATLIFVGLAATVTIPLAIGRLASRRYVPLRQRGPKTGHATKVARLVALLATSLVLTQAAHFNSSGNLVRATFEAGGAKWAWWLQQVNYSRNGVVAGFLYNTRVPAMSAPAGYSEARMGAIARRYQIAADRVNGERKGTVDDMNIVIVLSEAFSDLTAIDAVRVAEEPIPYTKQLMKETTSGSMLAQLLGGGTANMEFEVLTGMSLGLFNPQMNSPFQMLVPDYAQFPSAVHLLKRYGYDTLAIHPYMKTMYKRRFAYPALGFDAFLGEDDVRFTDRIEENEFVSDASAFQEVIVELRRREDPTLVNLVTMQNHYPTDGIYADPIAVNGLDGRAADLAAGYARGLRHTDDALRDFIGQLESLEEPTAVIFYGDHLPGFWPSGFSESQGLTAKKTPFFIWSNVRPFATATEPIVSPTHFLPMLFEQLDRPIPPYYALLDAVRANTPAMEHGVMLGPDGHPIDPAALSEEARTVLRDYRLVQYDLSVGNRFSLEELWEFPAQR